MARPNPLADPDFAQQVAEAFASGASRADMCELFGVKDSATITRWRKDPRVKGRALRLIEDRVLQVTRKVDGVIAERLEHASEMTITELLAVRKEFLGGALRAQTEKADEETITQAVEAMERDPDLAEKLAQLFEGGEVPEGIAAAASE
jgi:transposase-like protein